MFPAAIVPHSADIQTHAYALCGIVETLDVDEVPASQSPVLWTAFDRIERLAAAAKILLARRVDDSRVWEREGHRSAVDYLAEKSGTSKAASRGVVATSKKVAKLPATGAALRRGELSAAQAECVADGASHNRDAEEHLLETAKTSSLRELRDECARKKAAADPNPDATYKRIHEGRFCRQRRDPEGAWCLAARGTPDAGAAFNAALGPIIDEIFHNACAQGRRKAREQYAFDALIELARGARNAHTASVDGGEPGEGEAKDSQAHAGTSLGARTKAAKLPGPRPRQATGPTAPRPAHAKHTPMRTPPAAVQTQQSTTLPTQAPATATPACSAQPTTATATRPPRWTATTLKTSPMTRTSHQRQPPASGTGADGDAAGRTVPPIWPCCASTSRPYSGATPRATRSVRSQASDPYPSTEPENC